MTKRNSSAEEKLARLISDSARQIWAAGLGAFTLAEKEGTKLFETLARLGETIESSTRNTAKSAGQTVSGARSTATETWDKLEDMFELRVGRALNSLHIPTAGDIQELSERVDALSQAVDRLSRKTEGSAKKKPGPKKKKKSDKKKKKATGKGKASKRTGTTKGKS